MIDPRDADCHYGDHYWAKNGFCDNCGKFNSGILENYQWEKAEKAGLVHNDHYHRTQKAFSKCRRANTDEQ